MSKRACPERSRGGFTLVEILVSASLLVVIATSFFYIFKNSARFEKKAEEIRQNLKKLNSGFASFGESWEVLGKHMRNASSQYEEGNQRLGKFGMQLEQIQSEDEN